MARVFRLLPWVLTFVVVAAISMPCALPSTAAAADGYAARAEANMANPCRDAGDSLDGDCFAQLDCDQSAPWDQAIVSLELAGELMPASTFVLVLSEPAADPMEPSPPDLIRPTPVTLFTLIRT